MKFFNGPIFLVVLFLQLFLLPFRASAVWHITTLDGSGDAGYFNSIAVDSFGNPHIAYVDESTPSSLKYIYYTGSGWSIPVEVKSGDFGHVSLALNSSDEPQISYHDFENKVLKFCWKTGTDWSYSDPDVNPNVGLYTSIAANNNNKIRISYYDAQNKNLKFFKQENGWHTETVYTDLDTGLYTSLALNRYKVPNEPHIVYYDQHNGHLRYSYASADSGQWVWYHELWDNIGPTGLFNSLALDSNIDDSGRPQPHASYYDMGQKDLKYFYKTVSKPRYHIETLDTEDDVGLYTSLALDASNNAHISYYDATNGDLKYVLFYYDSKTWSTQRVDTVGDVGRYSSIALDSSDRVYISYYDYDNGALKLATTNGGVITTTTTSIQTTTTSTDTTSSTSVDTTSSTSTSVDNATTTTTTAVTSTPSTQPADTGGGGNGGGSNSSTTTTSVAPTTTTTVPTTTTSSTTTVPLPPPVHITSTPATTAAVGVLYFYDIETDLDGEPLTYALTVFPEGMQIDEGIGVVTWEPSIQQVGEHPVAIRVQADAGQTATQEFTLQVEAFQQCPATEVIGDNKPALSALRKYRDQRLSKTALGITLVCLYYGHSKEVSSILASRPYLRTRFAALLLEIVPALESATKTGAHMELPDPVTRDVVGLLCALQEDVSPELERSIDFVIVQLENGRLL